MANESCVDRRETRRVDMRTTRAEAHPCVERLYGDNRVQWGVLFMLFIWLNTEKEAEGWLNSIKKCSVV